jgi:hypothetical protein
MKALIALLLAAVTEAGLVPAPNARVERPTE